MSPEPGVLRANYGRLKKGMSLADVEKVFGKPAGAEYNWDRLVETREWSDNDASASIDFLFGHAIKLSWHQTPMIDRVRYRLFVIWGLPYPELPSILGLEGHDE